MENHTKKYSSWARFDPLNCCFQPKNIYNRLTCSTFIHTPLLRCCQPHKFDGLNPPRCQKTTSRIKVPRNRYFISFIPTMFIHFLYNVKQPVFVKKCLQTKKCRYKNNFNTKRLGKDGLELNKILVISGTWPFGCRPFVLQQEHNL